MLTTGRLRAFLSNNLKKGLHYIVRISFVSYQFMRGASTADHDLGWDTHTTFASSRTASY